MMYKANLIDLNVMVEKETTYIKYILYKNSMVIDNVSWWFKTFVSTFYLWMTEISNCSEKV